MARLRALSLAGCLIAVAAPAAAAAATPAQVADAVSDGAAWIRTQQDPATGEVSRFGGDWSLTAVAASGFDAAEWTTAGSPSAQDAYFTQWTSDDWLAPIDPTTGYNPAFRFPSDFARATLLAHAAGLQPSRLSAQQNLVAQLAAAWNGDGTFGQDGLNSAMFSMIALAGEGVPQPVLDATVRLIRDNAHDDGGWTFAFAPTSADKAGASDVDMTGAGIAALCTAGVPASDPAVQAALGFLHGKLSDDGSLAAMFGANADSNAWAIEGLNACGIDPQSVEWTTPSGHTPVDYLLSLQATTGADAGSFGYQSAADAPNLYSSQDAVRALAGEVFSAHPISVRPAPTVADGTSAPFAVAVDPGDGNVRFCRVVARTGDTVTEVLQAAQAATQPAGCVSGLTTSAGVVTALDGVRACDGTGWTASLDGGVPTPAGPQRVALGQTISLATAADATTGPCTTPPPSGGGSGPSTTAPVPPAAVPDPTPTSQPSATSPPMAAAPVGSADLRGSRTLRADRHGRVAPRVSCPRTATGGCAGTIVLRLQGKVVGRAAYHVTAGGTKTVRVTLTRNARKQLAKRGRLRMRLEARSRDASTRVSTRTVAVRAPR